MIDVKGPWRKGSGGRGSPWFLPQGTTTPCCAILEGCRLYHGTLTDGSFAGWKGQCSSHSPPGLAVSPCPASWASLVTISETCLFVYRSCGTWKARQRVQHVSYQPETQEPWRQLHALQRFSLHPERPHFSRWREESWGPDIPSQSLKGPQYHYLWTDLNDIFAHMSRNDDMSQGWKVLERK